MVASKVLFLCLVCVFVSSTSYRRPVRSGISFAWNNPHPFTEYNWTQVSAFEPVFGEAVGYSSAYILNRPGKMIDLSVESLSSIDVLDRLDKRISKRIIGHHLDHVDGKTIKRAVYMNL